MIHAIRNQGQRLRIVVSAVDAALWDLKAKIIDQPFVIFLEKQRQKSSSMEVVVSLPILIGKLNNNSMIGQIRNKIFQNENWARPKDVARVKAARKALATVRNYLWIRMAVTTLSWQLKKQMSFQYVTWFEKAVTSIIWGLHFIREHCPEMNITAGEYGYNLYFQSMLDANAVDILQAMPRDAGNHSFESGRAI
jgi:L-alanine-DL-glutamate epimerase-like enolase superfamily enzyme